MTNAAVAVHSENVTVNTVVVQAVRQLQCCSVAVAVVFLCVMLLLNEAVVMN